MTGDGSYDAVYRTAVEEIAPPSQAGERAGLHPLLADRHSPRAFAPTPVADDVLRTVLEAGRWSASSLNRQPWRFLVGRAGDNTHAHLVRSLAAGNQRWAPQAPVLLAAVAETAAEDGAPYRYASYDVGGAVAQLVLQAEAHGLKAHQMGGFDRDAVREAFGVPERFEPLVVLALGYPDSPEVLPEDLRAREVAPRRRRPLSESVFAGEWGRSLAL